MSAEPRSDSPPPSAKPEDDSWRDLATVPAGPPAGERSAALALGRLGPLRVFVVAADPALRDALARALGALRLGVEAGPPDDAGYRRAIAFRPDAVVSELTRPGEPGWWLLQRLRRHPLLRWTPVLLMRWWQEGRAGAQDVLVARVVDNLVEALTSLRVLGERIAAGRPLADRLEITGALPLLKALCGAGLSGALTLDDGLCTFDVHLAHGAPIAAARRGPGGEAAVGEEALFGAALCEFGRWSFRAQAGPPPAANVGAGIAEIEERIARRAGLVFGPDAAFRAGAAPALAVRTARLRDFASTAAGLARQLCEAVAGGASGDELDALLREGEDRLVAERTAVALMRCGALHPLLPGETAAGDGEAARAARSAAHVLAWIAADHRQAGGREKPAGKPVTSTGYYQVAPAREEKIALGPAEGIVAPGAWRPSMTADLSAPWGPSAPRDERAAFADTPASPPRGDDSARERHPDDPLVAAEPRPMPLLHDSLVPGPREGEERSRRQLWIALGLAVLLGALLVAGLVALAATDGEPPPSAGARP